MLLVILYKFSRFISLKLYNCYKEESAKGTSPDAIAAKIGRHVDTVKRFQKNPTPRKKRSDAGISKTVTDRDMRNITRQLRKKPGQTSKSIFNAAGPCDVPKSTRNSIFRTVGFVVAPVKMHPFTK